MRVTGGNMIVACGIAVAMSSAACNNANNSARSNQARGHEGAPINLTGCLQKEGGLTTTYILTQVNEPTRSVGTSGSSAANVDRERMREAKHSYRLSGDDDQMKDLVGKQVKVEGTIAENSDLNKAQDRAKDNRDSHANIDSSDLAKVDVKSIAQVSDACGNDAAK